MKDDCLIQPVPIVVWPTGTEFISDCGEFGRFYDCTWDFPDLAEAGAMVCCPIA